MSNVQQVASGESHFELKYFGAGDIWRVVCVIGNDEFVVGKFNEQVARKVFDYCNFKPEFARHAVRQLYLNADETVLEHLVDEAIKYEPKEYRTRRCTIEVDVAMKGNDEDFRSYLESKISWAVAVKKIHSITVHED